MKIGRIGEPSKDSELRTKRFPCKCGCGKTFDRITSRNRLYAPDCPNVAKRHTEQTKRSQARRKEREAPRSVANAGHPPARERTPVRRCQTCWDMPHRRPEAGVCQGCSLPFREEPELRLEDFAKMGSSAGLVSDAR